MRPVQLVFCISLLGILPSKALTEPSACDYFSCAFLSFEMAFGESLAKTDQAIDSLKSYQTGSQLLEVGTKKATSLFSSSNVPSPSAPCMVFASALGDDLFKAGRAYEIEARRTLNLIRDAGLLPKEAFDRLQCDRLIGEN